MSKDTAIRDIFPWFVYLQKTGYLNANVLPLGYDVLKIMSCM